MAGCSRLITARAVRTGLRKRLGAFLARALRGCQSGGTPIAEESFSGTSATFTALNGITADGWRARLWGSLVDWYKSALCRSSFTKPANNTVDAYTLGTCPTPHTHTPMAFQEATLLKVAL